MRDRGMIPNMPAALSFTDIQILLTFKLYMYMLFYNVDRCNITSWQDFCNIFRRQTSRSQSVANERYLWPEEQTKTWCAEAAFLCSGSYCWRCCRANRQWCDEHLQTREGSTWYRSPPDRLRIIVCINKSPIRFCFIFPYLGMFRRVSAWDSLAIRKAGNSNLTHYLQQHASSTYNCLQECAESKYSVNRKRMVLTW